MWRNVDQVWTLRCSSAGWPRLQAARSRLCTALWGHPRARPTRSRNGGGSRLNLAQIDLEHVLGNDPGLNGNHAYSRFNASTGAAYKLTTNLTPYAGYAEANRAPTPLDPGCSDPLRPCLVDNALIGDPPATRCGRASKLRCPTSATAGRCTRTTPPSTPPSSTP